MRLTDEAGAVLPHLLASLEREGYDFVAPTPATHARVVARPDKQVARDLRDIFGWSLPFAPDLLAPPLLGVLERAGVLRDAGEGRVRSAIRVSRLGARLFIHSAYPTEAEDAVFFGPDSYRFVDFLRAELPRAAGVRRLVDLGAGAGVGGIMSAGLLPGARLTLLDVNRQALSIAGINARHAGVSVELLEGDGLDDVTGEIDCVIANPPFIMDDEGRAYRDGGDLHGAALSLDWSLASAARLERGGRLLLYTGVAIVGGRDALREALERRLPEHGCNLRYREVDPDIFGEELEKPAYADVERIAAVTAVVEKG